MEEEYAEAVKELKERKIKMKLFFYLGSVFCFTLCMVSAKDFVQLYFLANDTAYAERYCNETRGTMNQVQLTLSGIIMTSTLLTFIFLYLLKLN